MDSSNNKNYKNLNEIEKKDELKYGKIQTIIRRRK